MDKVRLFFSNNLSKIVMIFSIVLSVAAIMYYYQSGYITAYGDSRAHLNIARRVFDNITPGMAQLGGVWLPLLHVLMFPFINNNFLWHSGLAGTLVSAPMYLLSVYFIYKTVLLITDNKISALISALIMMLNINFLYLQATPMTESLFVSTLSGSAYFLTKWSHKLKLHDLIIASTFFMLSTVNRYEGWPTVIAAVFLVLYIALRQRSWKYAEGKAVMFGMLATFGIFLWLSWQTAIFHNPLYFLKSEFSAKAQTQIAIDKGLVPQYKNFPVSITTYFYSLTEVLSIPIVLLGIIGFGILIAKSIISIKNPNSTRVLPVLILTIPGAFLVYALYKGNIPLSIPEIFVNGVPGTYFNIRYALYSLPAIAVMISIISTKKSFQILALTIAIIGSALLIKPGLLDTATIRDTKNNYVNGSWDILEWIKNNYDNGYILASAATSDPIIFGTGLNINTFITEGNEKYWNESMVDPGKYAKWVLVANDERDMLKRHMSQSKFIEEFHKVNDFGVFTLYKRNE